MNEESSARLLPPRLEAWLSDQPDSDRRALEDIWRLTDCGTRTLAPSDLRRKKEVWEAVSNSTRRSDREAMPRPRRVTSRTWRWVAFAAVVALLAGIGYMLRPITVEAPNGVFAEQTLSDGSHVQLNSGSSLTYRAHFLGTRTVKLEGEAFFDVVGGETPFVVETANARTTVLGTEFNVRSRSDRGVPVTSVVVASGRVEVASSSNSDRAVVLRRGERSEVTAAGMPTAAAPILIERETAWRHGGFAFNDQPFGVIFAEIERRFDVQIHVPADVASRRFTIYLQHPASREEAIGNLTQAEGLRYRETANGYEIYRP